jgi:hypothetical protein
MYAVGEDSVKKTLGTAAKHCRTRGGVVIVPDHVRERFEPACTMHGEDGADGRGVRFLEWKCDPDPNDGADREAYARFEQNVRKEYSWVPAMLFRRTRATILQSFLNRPSVYATVNFRDRLENAARDNLRSAIAELTS